MININLLKKKIIYRSMYRGTKEMDLLLGGFVKKYVNELSIKELKNLEKILLFDDEVINKWYFDKNFEEKIKKSKVSLLLRNFKL
jgi:antitoxin CptB